MSTSDGSTVWFGATGGPNCSPAVESYIYALDIAACDAAIAGGARHFMAKPYQLAELSRVLQEVLSSPRQLVDGTRQ